MVTGSPRSLTGAETSKNQNRYSIPITTDTADALETMPEDLDGYVRRRDETVAGVDGFLQNLYNCCNFSTVDVNSLKSVSHKEM
jgi:hypothetical protein